MFDRCHSNKLTTGCFPFQDHRNRYQGSNFHIISLEDSLSEDSSKIAKRLSECSFLSDAQSYLPTPCPATISRPSHIPYIDECSSANVSEDEIEASKNSICSSVVGHGFYSDSGFSSEVCDSSLSRSKSNSLRRATKWTTSFRKLIRRVSLRNQSSD